MKKYFEGWYFKLVDSSRQNVISVIPGVSFDEKASDVHAFIQVIDGISGNSRYVRYNIRDFTYSKKDFEIYIGNNYFTRSKITLDIADETTAIRGTLNFQDLKPWPVTPLSPGAMGWYAFVPFMECYHGVLSFDHTIEGQLEINSKPVDFTGGRGYIEKDWGKSFPRYHIWLQTNHFETEGTSLMVSIANIPWFGSYFDGFIVGLYHNNRLYKFATYTGALLTALDYKTDRLNIRIKSKTHSLDINVTAKQGTELRSPVLGNMTGRISESLNSHIAVELYEICRNSEKLIYSGNSSLTGLEIAGDKAEIAAIKVSG